MAWLEIKLNGILGKLFSLTVFSLTVCSAASGSMFLCLSRRAWSVIKKWITHELTVTHEGEGLSKYFLQPSRSACSLRGLDTGVGSVPVEIDKLLLFLFWWWGEVFLEELELNNCILGNKSWVTCSHQDSQAEGSLDGTTSLPMYCWFWAAVPELGCRVTFKAFCWAELGFVGVILSSIGTIIVLMQGSELCELILELPWGFRAIWDSHDTG